MQYVIRTGWVVPRIDTVPLSSRGLEDAENGHGSMIIWVAGKQGKKTLQRPHVRRQTRLGVLELAHYTVVGSRASCISRN